jgi:membrane protein implicated in regulation of membrane protease activity
MEMWIVWLVIAVVFLIVETLTVEIVSIWFTAASIVSMILSLCNLDLPWQIGAFAVVSILLIVFTRPLVTKYLQTNESKTNVESLIGNIATVTKDILPNDRGEVKVKGQYWLAISSDNKEIKQNAKVSILAIEGAKLIVKNIEE